jgi:hypothetical protein
MPLLIRPRFPEFIQEQCGGNDNENQNYDDNENRIINAGYELRDVKSLPYALVSALHQVIEMELLDHGLAVSADLVCHVVDVHGIKGVKIALKAGGLMVFSGWFLCFVFVGLVKGGLCRR